MSRRLMTGTLKSKERNCIGCLFVILNSNKNVIYYVAMRQRFVRKKSLN